VPTRRRCGDRANDAAKPAGLPTPVATIEQLGQERSVRPPFEEVLSPLATHLHVAGVHPTRGFKTIPVREPLVRAEDAPWGRQTIVPAGLEQVALDLLRRAGVAVHRVRDPIPPCFTPSAAVLAGSTLTDRSVVDFVAALDRGIIRVGPRVSVARLVAQVHLSFPDAKIAVAAARLGDVRRLGRALKPLAPATNWATHDDLPADPGRLVVATYFGLAEIIHKLDILICQDAREALSWRPRFAIGHATKARLFGLTAGDRLRAPYDRDRAWALFGFDELEIPDHGRVARPVAVAFERISGGPGPEGVGVVALKREGLWAHPVRNRRVARLARSLAGGGLAAEHPAVAEGLGLDDPGIVVLVEGIEHAEALVPALPGWDLLPGSAGPAGAGKVRAIATLDGLARPDRDGVDVVVRADGGIGVPAVLAHGWSTPYPGGRPLILVDFDDRHHPDLRRRSRGRRRAYRELGWAVDGEGPTTPVDRFLATRPGAAR